MRLHSLFFASLLALSTCTPAFADPACSPQRQWAHVANDVFVGSNFSIVELTPTQLANATKRYNSLPPPSEEHFDAVYGVFRHDLPDAFLIAFVRAGCVEQVGVEPTGELPAWIGEQPL
jgi:hypothetical protein